MSVLLHEWPLLLDCQKLCKMYTMFHREEGVYVNVLFLLHVLMT